MSETVDRLPDDTESADSVESREMSFLDHLEELRWRIFYAVIGVAAGFALVWMVKDPIMEEFLLRPARDNGMKLVNLRPFGQLFLYMQVAFFGGLVVSLPHTLYQVWLFVAPGLYPKERRYTRWVVVFTSFCFLGGVAFAYFVILPAAFSFFVSFGTPQIENTISIDEYFGFVINLMLGAGLVFELPMLSFFLSRLGFLTPKLMRKYWRHSFVAILIIAAFITPTPDPYNMLLLSLPMLGLYELSIWISRFSQPRRVKDAGEAQD